MMIGKNIFEIISLNKIFWEKKMSNQLNIYYILSLYLSYNIIQFLFIEHEIIIYFIYYMKQLLLIARYLSRVSFIIYY